MSAQKTLSQLSFAIVALFIAALPCFAQSESVTARAEEPSLTSANQVAVNNTRRTGTPRAELLAVAEVERSKNQPAFSATKFMQAVSESGSLENETKSAAPTMVINFDTTKFDGEKPASPKRITFVPSKGQRIPQ